MLLFSLLNIYKRAKMLNILESFVFLKDFPIANYKIVTHETDLSKIKFPYYIKATGVLHKTEQKAVLRCNNFDQAFANFKSLKKKFPDSEIIIQEAIDGIEFIIGLKNDKVFGKLLLVGFGGIFTETIRDIQFRALPLEKSEIESMIKSLKFYEILEKRKKYAIDKLINLVMKISKLDVSELDLNPVRLNEKEAIIVDARIEV